VVGSEFLIVPEHDPLSASQSLSILVYGILKTFVEGANGEDRNGRPLTEEDIS
jgi:hypothetical protein